MADDQPTKPKPKRLVKNPETFRERAIKASETSGKPTRAAGVKSVGGKLITPVAGPVRRGGGRLYRVKPLQPFFKILRFVGKIIFPSYFRESWQQLKLVTWPNWQQSRQLTFAVLIFAIAFGAVIAVVDYGLDKIFRDILLK